MYEGVLHETARTAGAKTGELSAGYGSAGYALKWNYGFTPNLDFGLQFESLSVGLRIKYAFINNREKGWSVAGALGAGASIGGSHAYVDFISSYLTGGWEPYGALRMVHVRTDPVDFKNTSTGSVDFTVPSFEYNYGQVILGTRYWMSPHWEVGFEVSDLFGLGSGVTIGHGVLVSLATGYRF